MPTMVEQIGSRAPHTLVVPDTIEDDASSQDSATDEEDIALSSRMLWLLQPLPIRSPPSLLPYDRTPEAPH